MLSPQPLISVIGASSPTPKGIDLAESVGAELARRGYTVVCGGLGGIMEAVCRGAKMEGGATIGILPGDSSSAANSFVDFPIVTGMGHARNVIVVTTGRAVISIDGTYGTLSEIAHALAAGIPVIGINTGEIPSRSDLQVEIIHTTTAIDAVNEAIEAIHGESKEDGPDNRS